MDRVTFLKVEKNLNGVTASITYPLTLGARTTVESDTEVLQGGFVKLSEVLDRTLGEFIGPTLTRTAVREVASAPPASTKPPVATKTVDSEVSAPPKRKRATSKKKADVATIDKETVESFVDDWVDQLGTENKWESLSDEEFEDKATAAMVSFLGYELDELYKLSTAEFVVIKAQVLKGGRK